MKKRNWLLILACILTAGVLFLTSGSAFAAGGSGNSGKPPVEKARKDLEQKLKGSPGFVGIAHSEEDGVITVFLEEEKDKAKVPDTYGGIKVEKEVTGKFKAVPALTVDAQATPSAKGGSPAVSGERLAEVRPLVGGISLSALAGQRYIYAGTLGMVTYNRWILSNAHVIAMNPDDGSPLSVGQVIVQPGTLDGGTDANAVGTLKAVGAIAFDGTPNKIDAAIADIAKGVDISPGEQFSEKVNYFVSGTATVTAGTKRSPGDTVRKSGRTSGVTSNAVRSTNAAVWVSYSSTEVAYFTDQILVKQPFIQSGDSGSAVDKDGKIVGLAFAAGGQYAIVCKADNIRTALGVDFGP